ncbi:hypothetical protein Bca52824_022346 [Brassica carinata]|uniref:Uncharacterized protein n=1 Tax=Brassica carinata TaxID=52824 RepID=A0A8X7VGK0_BRACI|nr:hypothetical protein Bca52824_022346 [Brassica carinata]
MKYVHPHATLNSSIILDPTPLLELSATNGSQTLCLGGEVSVDTASSSLNQFSSHKNSFTIGSSYSLGPFTTVKDRLSNNGKAGMVVQSEWRMKSPVTLSAEYDSKAVTSSPRHGLALALKP